MESFVRNFIRSSLVWLGIGVVLGLSMVVVPVQALMYRPAHVHANLLGFVSMMIFGVAYHVIPRFTGTPLRSRRLARVHLWVANVGLASLVGGWLLRPTLWGVGTAVLAFGAVASASGAFMFIGNLWRTLAPVRAGPAVLGGRHGVPVGTAPGSRTG
jgi:hypothetical protein